MNCLIIGHDASRTGAPIAILRVAKYLIEEGHTVRFLLRRGGEVTSLFEETAPTFIYKKSETCPHDSKEFGKFLNQSFDIVVINTVVPGDVLSELQLKSNVKIVCYVHELEDTIRLDAGNGLFDQVKKRANHYWAASEAVKANLVKNHSIEADNIVVLPGTVPESFFALERRALMKEKVIKEFDLRPQSFIVAGCGTIAIKKGVDIFIQVAKKVLEQRKDIVFIWFGGQAERVYASYLASDVEKLGINSHFIFAGNRNDMSQYLGGVDLFLLSSREDPFPLVCLEAGASGTPTIAFEKSGGIAAYVSRNNGVMVPYADVDEAAKAVYALKDEPEKYKALSEHAAIYVREKFSLSVIGKAAEEELLKYLRA